MKSKLLITFLGLLLSGFAQAETILVDSVKTDVAYAGRGGRYGITTIAVTVPDSCVKLSASDLVVDVVTSASSQQLRVRNGRKVQTVCYPARIQQFVLQTTQIDANPLTALFIANPVETHDVISQSDD